MRNEGGREAKVAVWRKWHLNPRRIRYRGLSPLIHLSSHYLTYTNNCTNYGCLTMCGWQRLIENSNLFIFFHWSHPHEAYSVFPTHDCSEIAMIQRFQTQLLGGATDTVAHSGKLRGAAVVSPHSLHPIPELPPYLMLAGGRCGEGASPEAFLPAFPQNSHFHFFLTLLDYLCTKFHP